MEPSENLPSKAASGYRGNFCWTIAVSVAAAAFVLIYSLNTPPRTLPPLTLDPGSAELSAASGSTAMEPTVPQGDSQPNDAEQVEQGPIPASRALSAFGEGDVIERELAAAEDQYNINMKRMLEATGKLQAVRKSKVSKSDVMSEYLVPTYPCALEGRFGLWGEGGKWVCLKHRGVEAGRSPVVISIGSKGDESFERDIHERLGAFSHTFDFSLNQADRERMSSYSFLKFYNAGLTNEGSKLLQSSNDTFYTLPQLLKVIGITYVDIFKIDCEGCEHGVVRDMVNLYKRESPPFGQIQMEIHSLRYARYQVDLLNRLGSLGYRLFHAEVNPFWGIDGYEIALIHESLVKPSSA